MPVDRSVVQNPMKVGFYQFFPGGGIGRYTHELLCRMAKIHGVQVELLASPEYHWNGTNEYSSWYGLKSLSHHIPIVRRFKFLTGQFINPELAIRYANQQNFDILHLANINHLSFPVWKRRIERTNIKVVATAHDITRQKSIISRRWEDTQLKNFYQFADALFVHSQYQADELMAYAEIDWEKIHIVPHGTYPHSIVAESRLVLRRKYSVPNNEIIVLFFGQLRDEKNLEGLLSALALFKKPLHLIIAGNPGGSHKSVRYYKRLIDTLNLTRNITFIPRYIENREVGELFSLADWVALPYDSTFSSQSGVLNTAVFYRKPVLVSSAPVLRETVKSADIGVAYNGDSPEDILRGIQKINEMIEKDYHFEFDSYQDEYSWEKNVSITLQVYNSLLNSLNN